MEDIRLYNHPVPKDYGLGRFDDELGISIAQNMLNGFCPEEQALVDLLDMLPDEDDEFRMESGEMDSFCSYLIFVASQIPHRHPAHRKWARFCAKLLTSPKLLREEELDFYTAPPPFPDYPPCPTFDEYGFCTPPPRPHYEGDCFSDSWDEKRPFNREYSMSDEQGLYKEYNGDNNESTEKKPANTTIFTKFFRWLFPGTSKPAPEPVELAESDEPVAEDHPVEPAMHKTPTTAVIMDEFTDMLDDSLNDEPEKCLDFDKKCARFVNIHAFAARFLQHVNLLDGTYYMGCLRDVLEDEIVHTDALIPTEADLFANAAMQCAAVWILYAGQAIYDDIMDETHEFSRDYDTGLLYDGPAFGFERWNMWNETLGSFNILNGPDCITTDTNSLTNKAANLMSSLTSANN